MELRDRVNVNILAADTARGDAKAAQSRFRKHEWPIRQALTSPPYIAVLDAAGVEHVDLFIGNRHDRPRRPHQFRPRCFDLYCALDGTAVLEQPQAAQTYIMLRLAQTMVGQIPALKNAEWPAVQVPPDADPDQLEAIVADAVRKRPPLPRAVHPEFKKRFSGSIYNPLSLDGLLSGDEGGDVWDSWRDKPLTTSVTVRQMLDRDTTDTDTFASELRISDDSRSHNIMIATCFTLLRRTGRIDPEGLDWLRTSLQGNADRGSKTAHTALSDLREAGLLTTGA